MLKHLENILVVNDPREKNRKELVRDVRTAPRILELWRKGVCLIDEVDVVLHPLKSELNFPIGRKEDLDFAPLRWNLPIHIMDAVLAASLNVNPQITGHKAKSILERLRSVVAQGYEDCFLQRQPHLILLNLSYYHQKFKPLLAEWIGLWLAHQGLDMMAYGDIILRFVRGDEPLTAAGVNSFPEERYIKMVNLAHDWLSSFLPHCLQKINRVTFGIMLPSDVERFKMTYPQMPQSRIKLAIPFIGKDVPSSASEFAHPDVTIGLTILAYRYQGLRMFDFNDILSTIQSQFSREMGPKEQRFSALRYVSWIKDSGGLVCGAYQDLKDNGTEKVILQRVVQVNPSCKYWIDSVGVVRCCPLAYFSEDAIQSDTSSAPTGTVVVTKISNIERRLGFKYYINDEGDLVAYRTKILPLHLLRRSDSMQIKPLYRLLREQPSVIHTYLEETIFPDYMRHKRYKLSASGQELGGEMLFGRTIGFSGTPSDLLPDDLGQCNFAEEEEGEIIYTLSRQDVVSCAFVPEKQWSVHQLLQDIASSTNPSYFALIDSGALITGMSNEEVARFLLSNGLTDRGIEGVVFLDNQDCKVVLVAATNRVVRLSECGIEKERRFAFYDQVHTTGTDIQHIQTATAAITLGKDMTLRDYAQGAYRMRAIGNGQRISVFIIPEVQELISSHTNKACKNADIVANMSWPDKVIGWLVINSMHSDTIQFNLLQLQNAANIWRKVAFRCLAENENRLCMLQGVANDPADDITIALKNEGLSEPDKKQVDYENTQAVSAHKQAKNEDFLLHSDAIGTYTGDSGEQLQVESASGDVTHHDNNDEEEEGDEQNGISMVEIDETNKRLITSLNIFREPMDFTLQNAVVQPVNLCELVQQQIDEKYDFIKGHVTTAQLQRILDRLSEPVEENIMRQKSFEAPQVNQLDQEQEQVFISHLFVSTLSSWL